jgi:hypothetical protein
MLGLDPCHVWVPNLFREKIATLLEDGGHVGAQLGKGIKEVAWQQRSRAAAAVELLRGDVNRERLIDAGYFTASLGFSTAGAAATPSGAL